MKYYKDFKPVDLDLIAFMETYKKEGTDGIEELTQLQMLIGHCTIEQIWKMIDYNTEVAVEILINCKGNADALGMYEDYLTQHCGWVTADNYSEAGFIWVKDTVETANKYTVDASVIAGGGTFEYGVVMYGIPSGVTITAIPYYVTAE